MRYVIGNNDCYSPAAFSFLREDKNEIYRNVLISIALQPTAQSQPR